MTSTGKEIHIRETAGIDRCDENVRVAVPFASGELLPESPVSVVDPSLKPRPAQFRVLKQWPDGSAKWLLVDCAVTVPAGSTTVFRIVPAACHPAALSSVVQVTPGFDVWKIDTGVGIFSVDVHTFCPFTRVVRRGRDVLDAGGSFCLLSLDGNTNIRSVIDNVRLDDAGPLRAVVGVSGYFELPDKVNLRFNSRLHFFAGSMAVRLEFTLHNPQAALHPGGLWDLGAPRSVQFRELAFTYSFSADTVDSVSCTPETGAVPITQSSGEKVAIYQESSGGANWQSPNHSNRESCIPMTFRGYVLEVNGETHTSGLRASPVMWCGVDDVGTAAVLPYFWQEFPKAIDADSKHLTISLFPRRFPDFHELQGGEQKTHLVCLDFAAGRESMSWAVSPLQAAASPSDYRCSGIFLELPDEDDLIDRFSSVSALFAKREDADEYGWRNFGDIYADHEAVYKRDGESFVSHYNNQYDFCAGAYRKFFASSNPRWGELAADLARHVLDIDIYHTDHDREEYNHGLFWHTDHYIDAGISTHRSYSHKHLETKTPQLCGGGPNAEHCYTTGLMLHYFQTGDPAFRDAVIKLAEWGLRSLVGSRTLLAACRRGVGYIKEWCALQGSRRLFPSYPLTRGTGNALNACLDAFEVGGGDEYLVAAETLIRGTLHPGDDIAARKLLDAEKAWSYTVLLVAVAKFIDKKHELGEMDEGFNYSRACLLAYAEWMLLHEYPYLDKPEILEYPNETWPAQDIRKSVIFFQAGRYASLELREAFRKRGRYFFDISCNELLKHETSRFSRPLALMLQNGWVGSRLIDKSVTNVNLDAPAHPVSGRPIPYLGIGSVVGRISSEITQALREMSVKREIAWLKERARG
jgi:hypothetical protein